MAGDWVRLKTGLARCLEVERISSSCVWFKQHESLPPNPSKAEVLALLYELSCWFYEHGEYGKMKVEYETIDFFVGVRGFAAALESVGYLVYGDDGVLMLRKFCDVSSARKSLGKAVRSRILSGANCAACGSVGRLTIDHIVPIARGGSCDEDNLQALCETCNKRKGKRTMTEFMAHA